MASIPSVGYAKGIGFFFFNHIPTMHPDVAVASILAKKFHAGQQYGNDPYTVHLEQVVDSVSQASPDERLQIVAWLHDILEDTDCPILAITQLFEDQVVAAVDAITRPQGMEKQLYLNRCKANPLARIVKIHDSLCNLRASVMRTDVRRIKKYTEQIAFLAAE